MKKSKFTEEQIAFALRQAESGTRVWPRSAVKWGSPVRLIAVGGNSTGDMRIDKARRLTELEKEATGLNNSDGSLFLDRRSNAL